jgi:hypothetical protein
MIFDRSMDYLRLFWLRPCGFVVRAFANDEVQRKRLEQVVKRLAEANFLLAFTFSRDFKERQRVRERGGIVVEWAAKERADVVMNAHLDEEQVAAMLVTLIIERQPQSSRSKNSNMLKTVTPG